MKPNDENSEPMRRHRRHWQKPTSSIKNRQQATKLQ